MLPASNGRALEFNAWVPETVSVAKICLGSMPLHLLNATAAAPDKPTLPPRQGARPGLVTHATIANPEPEFNAMNALVVKTYLQAALTLPKPSHPAPKPPKPCTSTEVCFRCLAPDHFVRQCRNLVRYRHYLRFGHRQFDCLMKLATLLDWERRRPPSIQVPATSRAVHAIPFKPRLANAPPPEPTSPPPP